MEDILKYRMPGNPVISQTGKLRLADKETIKEGFIFTSFDASRCYLFEPAETQEIQASLHFSAEQPYVFSQREYLHQAHALLNGIHQMQLGKAVLSRVKSTAFKGEQAFRLFDALCEAYPNALVYLLSSGLTGTWAGASPEVLLEAHEGYLFTMSLAGTKKSSQEEEHWGEKELHEQELVTEFITDQLKYMQVDSIETVGPYDTYAGPVMHLRTDISAELSGISPWKIAQLLHPTPAVSGLPRPEAMALIGSVETHDRGLYTGMFGLVKEFSAQLFVNLRCTQLQENHAYLYLGGGFTAQSIPESEWEETENKSRTLLNVMEKIQG